MLFFRSRWSPLVQYLLRLGLPFWLAGGLLATQLGNRILTMDCRELEPVSEIRYEETVEEFYNPGRGFYAPGYVHYLREGNLMPAYTQRLVHMRLDLTDFSGAYNKTGDAELTRDMLETLDATLVRLEQDQNMAIVRFAYDPLFSGGKTYEPSMEMILRHQEQLGEVLSEHADSILAVECGIFGKWGEMHGSDACTQENFHRVIDQWLEVLPESIPVSVRTITQLCDWLGMDQSELEAFAAQPGEKAYRVGIYDDAYLASDTDMGTYVDRKAEIAWLSEQTRHSIFGGEAGYVYGTQGEIQASVSYIEKEAFVTHLTYLNMDWNEQVVEDLKGEIYDGADQRYRGESGFTYVNNHMGYRFLVRGVRATKETPQTQSLRLQVDVENVGFANLVKPWELTLILKSNEETYAFHESQLVKEEGAVVIHGDPTKWNSGEITTISLSVPISEAVLPGRYQAYLRIASRNSQKLSGRTGYPIRFANEGENVWDESLGANFLGTITVTEKPKQLEWDLLKGITEKQ